MHILGDLTINYKPRTLKQRVRGCICFEYSANFSEAVTESHFPVTGFCVAFADLFNRFCRECHGVLQRETVAGIQLPVFEQFEACADAPVDKNFLSFTGKNGAFKFEPDNRTGLEQVMKEVYLRQFYLLQNQELWQV